MASEKDHIRLANRNHDALVALLNDGRFLDWATTVAFDKAVHVVEAAIANSWHAHSTSHLDRERTLKAPRYKPIFKSYGHLFAASRVARYLEDGTEGSFGTFSDYLSDDNVRELVRKHLYGVEQNAIPMLSGTARSDLKRIDKERF